MNLIIQQSREQSRQAFAFHSRAAIDQVFLVASKLERLKSLDEVPGPLETTVGFHPDAHARNKNTVSFSTDFHFKITPDGDKEALIKIEARFQAIYELAPEYEPSDEELDSFKGANAVFNCWPFFREYVQSTVTRMGYPAPPVPFLRIGPKQDEVAEKAKLETGTKGLPPPKKHMRRLKSKE